MTFGWTAATWAAIGAATAAVGVGVSAYNSNQANKQQAGANDRNKAAALKNQQMSDEANNRANAKSPDSAALMAGNALSAKGGQSGTMLTGPGGVDPSSLTLGKNSLLGG